MKELSRLVCLIDPTLKKKIELLSKKTGASLKWIVVTALEDYLKKVKEK